MRPASVHQVMRVRRLALALPMAALAGGVAIAGAAPGSAATTKKVQANNFHFCKASAASCSSADENHRTRVVVGTRVTWVYEDTQCDAISACPGHNVKFKGKPASADVKQDGKVIASTVFNSVGTFRYWCTHHKSLGMTGKVVVVAG